MHPRLWEEGLSGPRWGKQVLSLESPSVHVVRPDENWVPALSEADVALTDHTSLAGLFSVLQRPLIPVHVPSELLVDGTFFSWLHSHLPAVLKH